MSPSINVYPQAAWSVRARQRIRPVSGGGADDQTGLACQRESLQLTGSFKHRSAMAKLARCRCMPPLITASSGKSDPALATAARVACPLLTTEADAERERALSCRMAPTSTTKRSHRS